MKQTFSIGDLFRSAWQTYKENWTLFIVVGVVFALVGMLGNLGVSVNHMTGMVHQSPVIGLLAWLLQVYIGLGFIRFLLNMVDGRVYKLEDLFKGAQSFEHYAYFVVVVMLYSAFVGLGTLLLVIPGLVALIGFTFAQYLVAEQKADIFESFKESWRMTKGNRWKIFWLMIVVVFFNLFGLLALVVGLAITIPMSYLVYAYLYRTLGTDGCDDQGMEVLEVLDGDQSEDQ
ncbi:hypothetical protein KC866_03220 [Patescibacteria group bacterium]|nr:hypothetical protein [Patescibacteria group bacterium]